MKLEISGHTFPILRAWIADDGAARAKVRLDTGNKITVYLEGQRLIAEPSDCQFDRAIYRRVMREAASC